MLSSAWQKWLRQRFQMDQQKTLTQRDVLVFIYQQGYLYLVLIFICFVAGVNYANNLILGFCFLVSAVLCISFYVTFKQLHGLQIELHADEVGQVGSFIHLQLYVQQSVAQSRYLYIQVGSQLHKVHVHQLKHKVEIPFYPEHRGRFDYPIIQIYSIYPFGLVRAWTYFYHKHMAWIAPKAKTLLNEQPQDQQNFEQDMDEFRELRNYQVGESLQAVSWKQFARGQGLYVKVFEQYQNEHSITIDYAQMPSQSHEEKLEYMMALIEQCEQQQCAYRMYLPQAELAQGMGEVQLRQAKLLLAQA